MIEKHCYDNNNTRLYIGNHVLIPETNSVGRIEHLYPDNQIELSFPDCANQTINALDCYKINKQLEEK